MRSSNCPEEEAQQIQLDSKRASFHHILVENTHVHSQTMCSQHDTTACAQATSEAQQRRRESENDRISAQRAVLYMHLYFNVHRYGRFSLEINCFHQWNTRIIAWIRVYHQNLNSQNWSLGNGQNWVKHNLRVNYPFKRHHSAIQVKDFSNLYWNILKIG